MARPPHLAMLAAGTLLLAACGSTPTSPASEPIRSPSGASAPYSPTPADFAAVRRLMATQATDLLHRDRTGFLATVDAPFKQPAEIFYDNVTALRPSKLSYSVGDDGLVAATVPGGDPTFAPEMAEHLQVGGSMTAPVGNTVNATFVRRQQHWLLAAETASTNARVENNADAYDRPQWRPWFGQRIAVARDGVVTALTDRGSRVSATQLAHTMALDLAFDARLLDVPSDVPVVVDATTNSAGMVMNSLTGEMAGASEKAVYATSGAGGDDTRLAGHVIEANPKDIGQLLHDPQTDRHELTHLLLHNYLGSAPTWVNEGIAEYVGSYPGEVTRNEQWAGRAQFLHEKHVIPGSGVFGLHSLSDYAISHAAVRWLVETYGMARFRALLHFYRTHWRGSADLATPEALRRTYGLTLQQVTAGAWQELARLPW